MQPISAVLFFIFMISCPQKTRHTSDWRSY